MRKIDVGTFRAEMAAQGVSNRNHYAVKCVKCGTPQSMELLVRKGGLSPEDSERYFGFSCVGRHAKGVGCDWTLGGLFRIHELEVTDDEGRVHPFFEVATPAEAQALERSITEPAP